MSHPLNIRSQFQTPLTNSEGEWDHLLSQLTKSEEDVNYYQHRYQQMKSINESIIAAIKQVYSLEVGEQLEKLIGMRQDGFGGFIRPSDPTELTHTFCQKMKTFGSKLVSEQSIDQLPPRPSTPIKFESEVSGSIIKKGQSIPLSPVISKSNIKKQVISNSSFKMDYGEISTRRSYTPVRSTIATQILCQLCERVYPPNQFVNHAERCKYQLEYVETESDRVSVGGGKSKILQVDYGKMMKNLLRIRQEIEEQIRLVASSREQVDRVTLKRRLQKDLKKVIKVIDQKQQQIKRKKPSPSYSSRQIAPKKQTRLR